MKKTFAILSVAFALLSFSSCQQDAKNETGSGKLTITFGLEDGVKAYTQSTAKPTTSWANNIKSMMILFVESGVVKDVRAVNLPTVAEGNATIGDVTRVFTNVIAGNYTAYIIANYDQTGIATKYQSATGTAWDVSSVKGKNIADLLLHLTASAAWTTDKDAVTEASSTGYGEAGEIFLAKRTGINVIQDANTDYSSTPFTLTRAVSLFRVRIDPTTVNAGVSFTDAEASIRIRRAGTYINPDGMVFPALPVGTNLIYAKQFLTTATPAGYSSGSIIDAANGQTVWKDVRIFPGGSGTPGNSDGTNSSKFDIVLCGTAPAGYVNAAGAPVTAGTKLYWQGTVQGTILANQILEVNVTLNSKGTSGEVPGVTATGNLTIKANVADWGNIISTDLPI